MTLRVGALSNEFERLSRTDPQIGQAKSTENGTVLSPSPPTKPHGSWSAELQFRLNSGASAPGDLEIYPLKRASP
jgi:hypothetical protein